MAESSTIMGLVGAFIAIAIMLGVGIQILGNVQNSTNCLTLPGGLIGTAGTKGSNNVTQATATGWAAQCFSENTSVQNSYTLLIVILIIVAAVAILFVVRLL